jgi:hypothetical protein
MHILLSKAGVSFLYFKYQGCPLIFNFDISWVSLHGMREKSADCNDALASASFTLQILLPWAGLSFKSFKLPGCRWVATWNCENFIISLNSSIPLLVHLTHYFSMVRPLLQVFQSSNIPLRCRVAFRTLIS